MDVEGIQLLFEQYTDLLAIGPPSYNENGCHFSNCKLYEENYKTGTSDHCKCRFFYIQRNKVRDRLEACSKCKIMGPLNDYPADFVEWLLSDRALFE